MKRKFCSGIIIDLNSHNPHTLQFSTVVTCIIVKWQYAYTRGMPSYLSGILCKSNLLIFETPGLTIQMMAQIKVSTGRPTHFSEKVHHIHNLEISRTKNILDFYLQFERS